MLDSLRTRLLLWYTLILAIVIAMFAGAVCYLYWRSLVTDLDRDLSAKAAIIADGLRPAAAGAFDLDRPPEFSEATTGTRLAEYAIWNARGELIDRSNPDLDVPPPAFPGVRTREGRRELSLPARGGAIVLVGRDLTDARQAVLSLGGTVAAAGLAALALSLLGGWFLAGRALAPVSRISRAAAAMSAGDLSARIAIERTESELEQVSVALNQGFDQLRMAADTQRRFTADASHELRTPLATLSAEIDWALARERPSPEYRQALDTCRRAAARMRRIIEGLLTLARGDGAGHVMQRIPVLLDHTVDEAVALLRPLANRGRVTVEARLVPVTVTGDPAMLSDLVMNLLANAIEYNREGGTVIVETAARDGAVWLRVTDTGIGIDAADLPHIFDRFYRADPSRARLHGGAGLGLAIARRIVEQHDGEITCRSVLGEGTEMSVRLPGAGYSSRSSLLTSASSSAETAPTVSGLLRSTPASASKFIG